jgi:hypothetical protein
MTHFLQFKLLVHQPTLHWPVLFYSLSHGPRWLQRSRYRSLHWLTIHRYRVIPTHPISRCNWRRYKVILTDVQLQHFIPTNTFVPTALQLHSLYTDWMSVSMFLHTLTVEHDIIISNLESQMHQLSIHQQTIVDMLTIIIQDNNNCTIFYISIRQQFNRSTTVVQPQKSKHSSIRSHVWLTKWFISRNGSMPNNIQRNQYNVDLPAVNMPVAFHVHGPCNSSPSYLSPKCLLVLVESAVTRINSICL